MNIALIPARGGSKRLINDNSIAKNGDVRWKLRKN